MDYSTEELARKLADPTDRFFLVDALKPDSYRRGHIPGALSLPVAEVETRAAEVLPDKEAEIVTYCAAPT